MATTAVTLNGVTYFVPQPGEKGPTYDQDLTNYLIALATAFPQGGASPSSTFQALVSATTNPATAGSIRLAKTDLEEWRNSGNTGNDILGIGAGLGASGTAVDELYFQSTNGISGLQQITGQAGLTCYVTTPQTAFTTLTPIKFDTVVNDTDSGYVAGTGLYTVPVGKGGWYHVDTTVLYTTTGGPANVVLEILAAGVNVAGDATGAVPTSTGLNACGASWTGIVAAGATIQVQMSVSAGTIQPAAFNHFSQFSLRRLV